MRNDDPTHPRYGIARSLRNARLILQGKKDYEAAVEVQRLERALCDWKQRNIKEAV